MKLAKTDEAAAMAGKLTNKDKRVTQLLRIAPWLTFLVSSVPLPLVFLLMFLGSAATDSAAVYLFLAGISLGLGVIVGLVLIMLLYLYRRNWLAKLRDRLAADGLTASEVVWFEQELTTHERETRRQLTSQNPVLADAYVEILAARLTASRIIAKTDRALVVVRRRIAQAHNTTVATTTSLRTDLEADRKRLDSVKVEAGARLAEAKERLQVIEAAASRNLTANETDAMLRRLSFTQEHLPLTMEMEKLEQQAMQEAHGNLQGSGLAQTIEKTQ